MRFIFFAKIILLFLIFQNYVFSKGLPPGTGSSDIPANVLILLDKSGSMSTSINTAGINKPQAVAVDSNGLSYVGMSSSIVKLFFAGPTIDDSWSFDGSGTFCGMSDIKELRIHNDLLYVLDYNNDRLFRVELTGSPAICDWSVPIQNPVSMDIKNDILYATGDEMVVYDLTTSFPTPISCNYNGDLQDDGRNAKSLAIDSSGSNIYFHRNSSLRRYEIQGSNCPSTSRSSQISTPGASTVHSFVFKPGSDTIMYLPDYHDEFYKFTLNSSKTSATGLKASAGYSGNIASTTSPNRINLDWPYGIDVNTANDTIHFVSRGCCKHSMHIIDYDMQFVKESGGGQNITRMSGAVEAIQALVTDSSLTSHVDFGFGVWSESGASFTGWNGNITNGTPIPDHDKNSLKVRVHRQGAGRIDTVAPTIVANGWATYSKSFADLAQDYYLHPTLSPVDDNLDCQNTHVVVIGDGDFTDNISSAKSIISTLNNTHDIKTHVIAYGGGISSSGLADFQEFAEAGGTDDVIIANTPTSLKTQLRSKITQLIADNFAFTAPSIPPNKDETSSAVYQSSFKHKTNQSWRGELIRTTIDENGNLNISDPANWNAKDSLPDPEDRKIWSVIKDADYRVDYNNFVDTNSDEIKNSLRIFNFEVMDYHSLTGPLTTSRCASTAGVQDGNEDDVKGLINFLRGEDYFDYNGNCILNESRLDENGDKIYLGDFYHSELLVVGAPSANIAFTSQSQEAYWRSINDYGSFAEENKDRKEIIYVGGNDGMLHAFNSENGQEEWAFIPPLLVGNLPTMVDKALNKNAGGGTNAIYGVDGSPIVHDIFFDHPLLSVAGGKDWYTILMIPYGRGGNGFSILDVTDPEEPLHLYSVYNDAVSKIVNVIDYNGDIETYEYVAASYTINDLKESRTVTSNFIADPQVGAAVCDGSTLNQCYQSNTWTLQTTPKVQNLTKNDFDVVVDGEPYDAFDIDYDGSGDIVFTFGDVMRYLAYSDPDPNVTNSDLSISFKPTSSFLGVQSPSGYDYSRLGETWSQPRILRIPNNGAGDEDINDDIYAAVLGGGFGANNPGIGSVLFVINLEVDPIDNLYAKIEKQIIIEDINNDGDKNSIVNSTPALPTVITADEISSNFTGGLVYLNDLEGKITKFNLTNMGFDNLGVPISMYDSTTLFNAGATVSNGRYMYHSMDAGTTKGSSALWMYVGTGDYERLTSKDDDTADPPILIDNVLLGIKDVDFPYYRNVSTAANAKDLSDCSDTTNDSTGADCPSNAQIGWRIHLDDAEKVTAEPTLTRGRVVFPIFQPTLSVNSCSTGKAFLCNIHAKCGTPKNTEIGSANDLECLEVGAGVLSKVIVFGNKLFANIAGEANIASSQIGRQDLVSINSGAAEIESFRNSWRENY